MKNVNILKMNLDYDIDFESPGNEEDEMFIDSCRMSNDFKNYIEPNSYINFDACKIMKSNNIRIGVFDPKIVYSGNLKTAVPIVFIQKKKTILTIKCLNAIVYYLFYIEKVHRLEVRVFSTNKNMLNIMERSPFVYEGCIEKAYEIEKGSIVDTYYYSILKKEFDELYDQI